MKLKQLEIKGFKSFPDKTLVLFDERTTGIVGPNGCGKSNIIDSIRWVIGEQKIANLRSENLESLIFNGSKTRAASGFAEVILTFENTKNLLPTEFNTVSIARRFYKNGESEYSLNDTQCRLKDIHNLLLDTGISTDSYSIIELGMVDDLIKDKDNTRRKMLEQAAGISTYKTRKKEATQKLEATETDLNRIADILFEIEHQITQLEGQAKKAKTHTAVKESYRTLSLELTKASMAGFQTEENTLAQKEQEETHKIIELDVQIKTEEAHIEENKYTLINQEKQLQTLQKNYNDLIENIRKEEKNKALILQQKTFTEEKKATITQNLQNAEIEITALKNNRNSIQIQIQKDSAEIASLSEKMENQERKLTQSQQILTQEKTIVSQTEHSYKTTEQEKFTLEKSIAVNESTLQNIQNTILQIERENRNRNTEISRLNEEKTTLKQQIQQKKETLQTLQKEEEIILNRIETLQKTIAEKQNLLHIKTRQLDAKNNEYTLLKSLVDSMEGYPESIKFLHHNTQWTAHTPPILSDIIEVPESYRVALELILENYLNYYIVENESEAFQAVSLLEKHQKGKANFFILNAIPDFNTSLTNPVIPHTVLAKTLIQVEKKYENLLYLLLENIYILEKDLTQITPNYENQTSYLLVDKQGKFIKGKHHIYGGSIGIFENNKIGRTQKLNALEQIISGHKKEITTLETSITNTQKEIADNKNILKNNTIKTLQEEIITLEKQHDNLFHKIENITASQNTESEKTTHLQKEYQEKESRISDYRNALDTKNKTLENLQKERTEKQDRILILEKEYLTLQDTYTQEKLYYTEQKSSFLYLEKEYDFKKNQMETLDQAIRNNFELEKKYTADITTHTQNLQHLETQLHELLHTKNQEEKNLNTASEVVAVQRQSIHKQEQTLKQKQQLKEQFEKKLFGIREKINHLKLDVVGIKERLQVEFNISLETLLKTPRSTELSIEHLREQCEKAKRKLENLGTINTSAIEAFEEAEKRYNFIKEQKQDLLDAKEILLKTIRTVEKTANEKFLDTFHKVKENFRTVFKSLFTEEDECDLILENAENISETKVDIVAKPKGKRPSSITQLSGGEKTLTATALLFAIYLIKPAPFCILDEVDAPLDDTNVTKFLGMIKKFSTESQFIIVTHNKTTMRAVDILYGVTMQEAGVSKLVPVDFRSKN